MATVSSGTRFEFAAGKPGGAVLIVPLLTTPKPPMTLVSHADSLSEGAVGELLEANALNLESGQIAHTTRAGGFRRIIVVNLGKDSELTAQSIRLAAAHAARWLITHKLDKATLWLDGLATTRVDDAFGAWATAMTLAGWSFKTFTTKPSTAPTDVKVVLAAQEASTAKAALNAFRDAQTIADSVNYARSIAHQPPNVINPRSLAAEARRLAQQLKLKLTVIEAPKARHLGMNGLLSVGQGAAEQPCLIVLEYHPLPRSRTLTALVGKAVTFDTGGYSIKPAGGMESMKFDKCGGTAVLGILRAIATLRLPCNVVGVIAAAENAISRDAYRPSDIIRMYSGKTVEVTNTDAEGRLILADALWYVQEHFEPTRIIDFATLTGGVVTALGSSCAGLMANNDSLADELQECGRATHERLWRLPVWDEYLELLKSTEADFKNSSSKRHAHPIVGGIFLKQFVKKSVPWAHLDIAGTATDDDGNPMTGKGATGFGIRLIVEYLRRHAT